MRKFLMGLTVLTGAVVAASGANAAPRIVAPAPFSAGTASAQAVQFYATRDYATAEDWRHRERRRREEFERLRRHDEWRHERREAREHERHGW